MSGFKNHYIEYEDRNYFLKLFGITSGIDACVYHRAVMSKEFLLELKNKMLFALVYSHRYTEPKVEIIYHKEHREGWVSYRALDLISEQTVPIYSDAEISTSDYMINQSIQKGDVYLTSDFNKIIRILNINNYQYYNDLITKEESISCKI